MQRSYVAMKVQEERYGEKRGRGESAHGDNPTLMIPWGQNSKNISVRKSGKKKGTEGLGE